MLNRRTLLAAIPALGLAGRAYAQAPAVKIGVLQDVSGPFAYINGAGTIACIRAAIDEVGHSLNVELLQGDHLHKPDVGLAIARQWLDTGVDAVIGFDNSAIALAVSNLVRDRDRVLLGSNVAVASLSGANCTPNETHWQFDTAMLARALGTALTGEGLDTWFFIRADYVFGRELQDDTRKVVAGHGGRIVGDVAVPLGSTDFGSALLSAQASKAKVIALALAGADLTNCIKQAAEFGVTQGGQTLAAMIIHEQDIHAIGLASAQKLSLAQTYYWDLSDRSRAFARRITPGMNGVPPNASQANAYSAVRHYLKAVAALGPAAAERSGRATVARMKEIPVQDDVLDNASIRADGRVVSDVHLLQTKTLAESRGEWDLLKWQSTVNPGEAWRPMAEGGCPLVRI